MASASLRKRENTRARLEESAVGVFLRKGFAGAKIDDVVKGAGFTRGAFYSNFSSMEELLHEVVVSQAEEVIGKFRKKIAEVEGEVGVETLVALFESVQPQGGALYILVAELQLFQLRNPDNSLAVSQTYERFKREVASLVEQVLVSIGRKPNVPLDSIASIVISGFLGAITHAEIGGKGEEEIIRPFLEGTIRALSETAG